MSGANDNRPSGDADDKDLWIVSAITLAVIGGISELVYLALGTIVYRCSTGAAACSHDLADVLQPLVQSFTADDKTTHLYVLRSIGLPGFNNLFYLIYGYIGPGDRLKFYETIAISCVAGLLAVFVFVKFAAGHSAGTRLVFAILAAVGWALIYNGAELSIFGGETLNFIEARWPELPVAAAALFIASFFVGKRARQSLYGLD